jgi:hypothetical protein
VVSVAGARILNSIFWLYLWLSDALEPVGNSLEFWSEKTKQLFRFGSHLNDPAYLIGSAIIPALLWFAIDWRLRRRKRNL